MKIAKRIREQVRKKAKKLLSSVYKKKSSAHYSYLRAGDLVVHEVTDPKIMRDVIFDMKNFQTIGFLKKTLSQLIGQALIIEEGETWKTMHGAVVKSFSRARVKEKIAPIIIEECEAMVEDWAQKGQVEDVEQAFLHTTGRVIMRSIFSDSFTIEESDKVLKIIGGAIGVIAKETRLSRALKKANIPYDNPAFMPTLAARALGIEKNRPGRIPRKLKKAVKEVDDIIYRVIHERRGLYNKPDDIMTDVMQGRHPNGYLLSDSELRDQLVMLIIAGHETTAGALTFSMLEAVQDPSAPRLLREEFNAVVGDRKIEVQDFRRLTYARSVFHEGLRLHPPLRTATREVANDTTVAGVNFKQDDIVLMDVEEMQTHPDHWPDGTKFNPGQWAGVNPLKKPVYPFGGGPRRCPGAFLSEVEAAFFLTSIFGKLSIKMTGPVPGKKRLFTARTDGPFQVSVKRLPQN